MWDYVYGTFISYIWHFSFLSLLPEELKSSYQTADSGYDMYLRDAHKQVQFLPYRPFSFLCV